MMGFKKLVFGKGYGYGKLLGKTTSTDVNFSINRINPDIPITYTIIDNSDGSVVKESFFTSTFDTLSADLSATSGDCSIYVKVDDSGNSITFFKTYKNVSALYLSVIPYLKYLTFYGGGYNDITLKSGNLNNLEIVEFQDGDLIDFDFSNTTKIISFITRYTVSTNIPLNLSRNKKIKSLWVFSNMGMTMLDTLDMADLSNLKIYGNPIEILNIDNLPKLSTFILKSANELTSLVFSVVNINITYLQIWSVPNGINTVDLSLAPSLNYAYLRAISLQNIIIDNPYLENLYLSYNNLSSIIIPNSTNNIKAIWVYGNSSLTEFTHPALPLLTYINIGGYNHVPEFNFSECPLLATLICNHANFRKINLKNGNTNAITSLVHTYYADCCFLVDDDNDPVIADWTLRSGDVVTSDQSVYDAF